jgi:ADP-ribosyl-[dinitrogen reductase] hydrolase
MNTIDPHRVEGCLLGLACGNTLGVPFENLWPASAVVEHTQGRVRGWEPQEKEKPWDDDTAQAVLVAQMLAEGPLTLDGVGLRLVRWKSENGRGIKTLVERVLDEIEGDVPTSEASLDAFERLGRNWSATNTAMARCIPVALRHADDSKTLVEQTGVACRATHWNPLCVWSATAFNLGLSTILRNEPLHLQALAEEVRSHGAPDPVCDAVLASRSPLSFFLLDGKAKAYTLKAMQVGLWALLQPEPNVEELLESLILEGGDTGTNAAIAGAALGARLGREGIGSRWIAALHDPEAISLAARRLVEG